jgi:hypothetical protein
MLTAQDATAEDYCREQIAARFGPRTHLQLKECAELLGLKTTDALNKTIVAGTLEATLVFGHCPRLRWVAVPELVRFLCTAEPVIQQRRSAADSRTPLEARERIAVIAARGEDRSETQSRRGRSVR